MNKEWVLQISDRIAEEVAGSGVQRRYLLMAAVRTLYPRLNAPVEGLDEFLDLYSERVERLPNPLLREPVLTLTKKIERIIADSDEEDATWALFFVALAAADEMSPEFAQRYRAWMTRWVVSDLDERGLTGTYGMGGNA